MMIIEWQIDAQKQVEVFQMLQYRRFSINSRQRWCALPSMCLYWRFVLLIAYVIIWERCCFKDGCRPQPDDWYIMITMKTDPSIVSWQHLDSLKLQFPHHNLNHVHYVFVCVHQGPEALQLPIDKWQSTLTDTLWFWRIKTLGQRLHFQNEDKDWNSRYGGSVWK